MPLLSHGDKIQQNLEYTGNFSAFNEDKLIFDLLINIPDINKFYVDIGANDGVSKSNTRRLALNGWKGLCFELDPLHVRSFKNTYHDLNDVRICEVKVTPVNVSELLVANDVPKDFGVLSLDIDSYDYFVLEKLLNSFRPTILIVEINEKIPPPLEFTVLYSEEHSWDYSHFFGLSICQLEKLCLAQNYAIAFLEYNNAILVAKEKYTEKPLTAKEAYESGYQFRTDRKEKFPYNENMEILLTLSPEDSVDFLQKYFKKYEGKFILNIGDPTK